MRPIFLVLVGVLLMACQGGRGSDSGARAQDAETAKPSGSEQSEQQNVLLDPLASALEPVGLGFRVDTTFGHGDDAVTQTGFGVNALAVGVDVDGDSSTGNLLGADIRVHFFTLLLYGELTITRLDGAPDPMPLKVEVSVLDPRNLLGLPGLLGVVDPDLRISLGMDASQMDAPQRFHSQLSVLDSIFSFLPRFTSASLTTELEGAQGDVAATLSMYADRGGERADALTLSALTSPASAMDIQVTLAPDAEQSNLAISVSAPSKLDLAVSSYDGLDSQPESRRDIELGLDRLDGQMTLDLQGVDGLSGLEGVDTRYLLSSDAPIETLSLRLHDLDASGQRGEAYARLSPLPQRLEVVQGSDDVLTMSSDAPIDDLIFAQAENAHIVLSGELDPTRPFSEHLIRQYAANTDGNKVELMQLRLGGLSQLNARLGDEIQLNAELSAAPLTLREESDDGFQEAVIERLPAQFSLAFPDTERQLDLAYSASESGPGLSYREQRTDSSTQASIRPLPQALTLCSSSDGTCGSNGVGTDTSLLFEASESLTINYRQQSADGRRQVAIDEFVVRKLQFDLGTRSGGKRGYLFFDTDGHAFSGAFRQVDGDNGVALLFSEGSFAEDRYVEYDDYIRIKDRRGAMRCPGRRQLEIRTNGVWIDGDFVLDQLCQ